MFGNLDSIPQDIFNSFSINPAYKNISENLDDTIFLLNQIVVYWKDNTTIQQRSSFETQYNLTFSDEFYGITIFDVEEPFMVTNEVFEDQLVEYSIPRFLSKGFEPHTDPSDEFFPKQWYLHNTGQEIQGKQGFPGADINVLPAWDYVKGTGINIAIIDEGVPIHPDIPSSRQIRGEFSNVYNYLFEIGSTFDDPSPIENEAHGTAVAGIVAAEMNNGEGIVGVAPESNIIPLRIRFNTYLPNDIFYLSILLAMEYGADIIVLALGIHAEAIHLTQLAMIEALDEGIFIVCSASNTADHEEGISGRVSFPASFDLPGVISVGASNREDKQANYSPNRDHSSPFSGDPTPDVPSIDIVAPGHSYYRRPGRNLDEGGNIFTTDMMGSSGFNHVKIGWLGIPPEENPSEGINYLSYTGRFGGTSASAPQVAGVIALILDANPELTMLEVLDILYGTADKVWPNLYDYYHDPFDFGRSFETGYGRVNAGKAVFAALGLENCGDGDDLLVNSSELIENNYFSPGSIVISSGGELTIRSSVYLSEENSLIVEEGGKLILEGPDAIIDRCPESNHWKGIKIEAGGELLVNDGTILNTLTGIDAYGPSNVNIDGITIHSAESFQGAGIKFFGNVTANSLRNIDINDFEYGIDITASDNFYHISTGEINNVKIGVRLRNTSAKEIDLEIESEVGIHLYNSPGSMIIGNQLQYTNVGLVSFRSHNLVMENNWIGIETDFGINGINLIFNRGVQIKSNPLIKAKNTGIYSIFSDILIKDNTIIVEGNNNHLGGIRLINGPSSQILNNQIETKQSAFAIESNNNRETLIKHNYIKNFSTISSRTAAIRSMGSTSEEIEENLIVGVANTTGILAQNSSFNTYGCNEIINTAEGIGIYHNSPIHLIRGNELKAAIDLSILSVVGQHVRQGNKFIGGSTRAIGLDQDELDESKFFVNPTHPYHMPDDPVPGNNEWFDFDQNQNYYQACGQPGPTWVPFDNDPHEICDYYHYLKIPDSLKPNKYFLGVFDLLLMSEMRQDFDLPNCILLDQEFQNLCGLSTLVNASLGLDSLSMKLGGTDSLTSYQEQWVEATDSTDKALLINMIGEELESLDPVFTETVQKDSMKLDNTLSQLNSVFCESELVVFWSGIYIQYIHFLQNEGKVDSANHNTLRQYSSLCSDVYGKPVHLARALTATFDTTYFDQYDDCIQGEEQRIVQGTPDEEYQIEVYPNPTTGLLQIALPENYSGELTVLDMSGKIISTYTIQTTDAYSLQMPDQSGIYLLRFESSNGDSEQHRVMVVDYK